MDVTILNVNPDFGSVKDITKCLGEGNWRVLFVRNGLFQEAMWAEERLSGGICGLATSPTIAEVEMSHDGGFVYNVMGRLGAIEDVAFAVERIEDIGEVEVGEGVRPTVVPLVVQIGAVGEEFHKETFLQVRRSESREERV